MTVVVAVAGDIDGIGSIAAEGSAAVAAAVVVVAAAVEEGVDVVAAAEEEHPSMGCYTHRVVAGEDCSL